MDDDKREEHVALLVSMGFGEDSARHTLAFADGSLETAITLLLSGQGIDRPLAIYHRQERSLSSNPWRSARGTWEVFRDHLQLSRGQAALCLGSHLARRVLRG